MASSLPIAAIAAAMMPINDEEPDVVDFPELEDVMNLGISEEAAARNYSQCGALVPEEVDTISWADSEYEGLYTPEVAAIIDSIAATKGVTFKLKDSQEIVLHSIAAGRNVFFLTGTGQGKTVAYTWGVDVARAALGIPHGVAIVTAPRTAILTEKMGDNPKEMIILTLQGSLKVGGEEDAKLSGGLEEEIWTGRIKIIIGHPEAWATPTGQRILMELKKRKLLILLAADEFHKMLPKHWESFR